MDNTQTVTAEGTVPDAAGICSQPVDPGRRALAGG